MSSVVRFDASRFNRAFKRLAAHSKKGAQEVLFDQARSLVRRIIDITPPATGKADIAARKRGEAAATADLSRIFSSATPDFYDRFLQFNGGPELKEDFAHRGAAALGFIYTRALTRGEMVRWHNDRRGNRGRVKAIGRNVRLSASEISDGGANRQRAAQVTTGLRRSDLRALDVGLVKKNDYAWFKKRVRERVGLLAGGWNRAAARLGARVPAWVRRHGEGRGDIIVTIKSSSFSITMSNDVRYSENVKGFRSRVQRALNDQAGAMERRLTHYFGKARRQAGI